MLWILSILAFVVIFSLLILIHEGGHFFMAKRVGIKVEEFGLGMPPRLWGYRPAKSETIYSINAIPFGGFVRLYGEDLTTEKALKNTNSFVSKKPWQKLLVVSAGVIMNFLLAYLLLIGGLTVGMQPLLATADDFYAAINAGVVKVEAGMIVKAPGSNDIGFLNGDQIVSVDGVPLTMGDEIANLQDQQKVSFELMRNGNLIGLSGVTDLKKPFFEAYDQMPMPQVVVLAAATENSLGVKVGDVISKVDQERIFSIDRLEAVLAGGEPRRIETEGVVPEVAAGAAIDLSGGESSRPQVVISQVVPGSSAAAAGLRSGDQILAVNSVAISDLGNLASAIRTEVVAGKAVYKIRREANEIEFYLHKDAEGMVGVVLSPIVYLERSGLALYTRSVPYSVLEISDVSYPIWQAPYEALREIGRLSVFTVESFVVVFESIFTRLVVPEGVAGPVGIAQMTYVFVQQGFVSLIRFTALLSMSLAIINILPFPGLDGGRFFLILIPALIGRKLNPKWEAMIHVLGFLLLMLLLLVITFNDIARLFS